MAKSNGFNIVHEQNFIRATRDTGYRSTASAISELVDNAVQAKAKHIRIFVEQDGVGPRRQLSVAVLDDGVGMDRKILRSSLRFGGSSRFNDRKGQGRFGMGLPNSSVSQARRVDVYTWNKDTRPIHSYLDVDEITKGHMEQVPAPRRKEIPSRYKRYAKKSGTLIAWSRCDRLDNRKASTIIRHLAPALGQQFRYFLWNKVKIEINGEVIDPVDPLYITDSSFPKPASMFGDPMEYEVRHPDDPSLTSSVIVRFTELPINALHGLSDEDKRSLGITKGAGVSIVRADREIDFGWHFMGRKRKENYDDWWRCEVRFEPELDELFGVTHSKQQVTPSDEIKEILAPDLEAVAHALNSRVRAAYGRVRASTSSGKRKSVVAAKGGDSLLAPQANSKSKSAGTKASNGYEFKLERLRCPEFFTWRRTRGGKVAVSINTNHPFYEQVYESLSEESGVDRRVAVEKMLIALAKAEIECSHNGQAKVIGEFKRIWSDTLATYLGEKA